MVSWYQSGAATGYYRATGSGIFPNRSVWSTVAYKLSSPGTVDLNAPTRMQYQMPVDEIGYTIYYGSAHLRFVQADFDANPGKRLSGTAYIAPASAFSEGHTPSPAEIKAAATVVARGFGAAGPPDYMTAPGDFFMNVYDSSDLNPAWPPNTKYWYMIAPTAHVAGSVDPTTDTPVGDINVNGRAISFWSNRTPEAPVITSPLAQTNAFAGSTVRFAFASQDPDRIQSFPGDVGITDFGDVAGFHIQYAPRPSVLDPEPEWIDLPIVREAGAGLGVGWYIEDANTGNLGAVQVWKDRALDIRCGSNAGYTEGVGYLPSGDWQLRVRTFDYGHGRPDSADAHPFLDPIPPLADYTGDYDPYNYPEVNTSPWSESVFISVSEQVPAPIPLSPSQNMTSLLGDPVTLRWQYRNTYAPPYAQLSRTVQIRRVGDPFWVTLVDADVSSDEHLLVSGFEFVSGNQYAWRVMTTDTSGASSVYSEIAYFWVVPVPESGAVIPDPSETVDGGTLGCGTHRVEIYRRGGRVRVGQIRGIEQVEWNRLRDDISDARIVIKGWDIDCGNLLAQLHPWAYEVVIFRDNGQDIDRVWEGPITLLTYESERVVIQAKDVMAYAYRRIIKQAMSDSGNSPTAGRSVVARATEVLQNVFAPDDPNVLAYLTVISNDNDAKQYRSLPAYSRTGYEEVDDMAANAGLDYTAIGRAIVLWGTKNRIGTLPEFRDKDLGNSPIVSEYGMSMANRYVVSDGNGVWGEATRLDENDQDLEYGLIEMLSSTWASDSTEETGTFTQAGIEQVSESFAESAERSIDSRYPAPLVVRIPDNTKVNPDAVISIRHLVPGAAIPLHSVSTLREIRATQKLDSVKMVEVGGVETITITLSPFSRQDDETGEGA